MPSQASAFQQSYLRPQRRADSHGRYALRALPNGQYILFVDVEGRPVFQGRVTLKDPTLIKNIELH
jgi:hypothetical protein